VFFCFLGPVLFVVPEAVGGSVLDAQLPSFSSGHLLGTDLNGNDEWSRLLHGGRVSLSVAFTVNLLGLVVGATLGMIAGYAGGVLDSVTMRLLDVLIAFPSLVMVVAVAQALGPNHMNTVWALAFFAIPAFARMARVATLRIREQPFMLSATLSGTRTSKILATHVFPNILPQLLTFALLGMGITIIIEDALSFLGLGIRPPAPSWGNMIAQGQQALSARPALLLLPSAALFVTILSLNLLAEALRKRWNER
jgi:peptide/nickel transport system permease protein